MMVTSQTVSIPDLLQALRDIEDPEIGTDIVELGLIYSIDVSEGNSIHVAMTTTTRNCPASAFIADAVKAKIEGTEGVREATVDLVYEPLWSPAMIGVSRIEVNSIRR